MLQCVAVCCSVLQCTLLVCSGVFRMYRALLSVNNGAGVGVHMSLLSLNTALLSV